MSAKSKDRLNIYQRQLAVMAELKYIQKEDKKVNNQYTFVAHDAVSAALHPLLVKHEIAMIPSVEALETEKVTYNKWNKYEKRLEESYGYVVSAKVKVSFVAADDPSDRFEVFYHGQGLDSGDKAVGKAISYACKYAMLKTFCLETGDEPEQDADSCLQDPKEKEAKEAVKELEKKVITLSQEQIEAIEQEIVDDQDKKWLAQMLKKGKKASLKEVPQAWYMDLNKSFEAYKKQKEVAHV